MINHHGRCFSYITTFCFFWTSHAQANTNPSFDSSMLYSQFGRILFGLAVVLLVIVALAWLAKKLNLNKVVQGSIRTLAVSQINHQTKVILIDLDGQQYLLGVTAHNVNLIDKLEKPVDIQSDSLVQKLKQVTSP